MASSSNYSHGTFRDAADSPSNNASLTAISSEEATPSSLTGAAKVEAEQTEAITLAGDAVKEASEEADELGTISIMDSFGALRDRSASSKMLKAQRQSHEDLRKQIASDQSVLEDNRYILANFEQEMAKQQNIVSAAQDEIKKDTDRLEKLQQDIRRNTKSLSDMQKEHRRVQKEYAAKRDAAKDEFTKAKKQANAVGAEVDKAEKTIANCEKSIASLKATLETTSDEASRQDATAGIQSYGKELVVAKEELQRLEARQAEVNTLRTSTQAALDGANRTLKDITGKQDKDERTLEKKIKNDNDDANELRENIESLNARIKVAQQRMAYSQQVYENPETTDQLEAFISENHVKADSIRDAIAETESQRQEYTRRGGKAIAVIVIACLIIAVILVLLLWPR